MIKLKGLGVSPGIAAGHPMVYTPMPIAYTKESRVSVKDEIARLNKAVENSIAEIKSLYTKAKAKLGHVEAGLFEAQIMMLQDEDFITKIEEEIVTNRINGEWAIANVRDYYVSVFESLDHEYLKERAQDIKDIAGRLIKHMQKREENASANKRMRSIVVARELTPSDTAYLNSEMVLGLLIEAGGCTSLTSTLARTMGIPTVVGIPRLMESIQWNEYIAFDGESGEVYINPTQDVLRKMMSIKKKAMAQCRIVKEQERIHGTTRDGRKIPVLANAASLNDIKTALENGAEGIGLFQTEYMFLGRYQCPTEQEQFDILKSAALHLGERPLTVRTLDIGSDKRVNYLDLHKEENAYLGRRAIRHCLERRELFKTQLRAILRASASGAVRIMFPMICTLQELREAKQLLEECKKELDTEGIPCNKDISVGMTIETPAAALMSDIFARECDFFSIDADNLLQYTLAVDRFNPSVQYLYSLFQPSFLRLVQKVVDNAHQSNIKVCICGEAAQEKRLLPVLIGMGVDEFSVNIPWIRTTREEIWETDYEDVQKWIPELFSIATDMDVEQFLEFSQDKLPTASNEGY
jgi:phosphotransferase system enzyme I (PtsI)